MVDLRALVNSSRWGRRGKVSYEGNPFKRVAEDLLSLEVNKIIKPCMTARKMPPFPFAVLEIAGSYYWYLHESNRHWRDEEVDDYLANLDSESRRNRPETFADLRQASQILRGHIANPEATGSVQMTGSGDGSPAETGVILDRIYRNSSKLEQIVKNIRDADSGADQDTGNGGQSAELWNATRVQLLGMLPRAKAVRIDLDDAAEIRKIWKVGTERVAMQSTIGLDGDVVTRIGTRYKGQDYTHLHKLHLDTSRLAIETWHTMANLVASFISGSLKSVAKLIMPK